MIVAEITKDRLWEKWHNKYPDDISANLAGKQFDSESLRAWWGWGLAEGTPEDTYFHLAESNNGRINFKLYDDDNELYYEGWLIDDDECMVQQFVLRWAESDSGCTTITVYKNAETGWVQEIS